MSDDSDGGVAVATVRERMQARDDVDVSEEVLTAIQERAEDGRIEPDAMAAWHRECREERRSTVDAVEDTEASFRALVDALAPIDQDITQVQARIDEYGDQFDAMRTDLSAAADELEAAPRRPSSPADVYLSAAHLLTCERAIHEVDHGLHHAEDAVEQFETWLHDPETRLDAFAEELDGLEQYLDNTAGLLDRIDTGPGDADQRFDWWLAAHHLQQVMSAVFAELRTDLAELDSWLDRQEGDYGDELTTLRAQIDSLEERHAQCSAHLDETAERIEGFDDSWTAVAETVESFETQVDDLEPPIDWGEVERLLQTQFDELDIEIR